ncbi:MAG: hypothetical protein ABS92_06565 [Thiobacillus sp. SCN 63-374]|nr:MAG: hypothetical protein ABS92_06565 [Thiobacillus sp. SCN 63-374]
MIEILLEFRGVFTAILVALIAIGGAFALQRYLATRNAVLVFKSAFSPEIAAIANGSYTIDTFSGAFQRHEAAINAIRPILPERYQRKLQKAWNEYCGKNTDLELEPEEYVQAFNALLYSEHKEMFGELKARFKSLHGCLDGLL